MSTAHGIASGMQFSVQFSIRLPELRLQTFIAMHVRQPLPPCITNEWYMFGTTTEQYYIDEDEQNEFEKEFKRKDPSSKDDHVN